MDQNTNKRLKTLERKVEGISGYLPEIRRQAGGTARANRQCAQHEQRLAQLTEEIKRVNTRIENLGDNAGPVQTQAIMAEATRIEGKLDGLWADLNAEIEKLREQVSTHGTRLDGHDELFEKLAAANKERDGRTVVIGESVARAHARIDVLSRARQSVGQVHPAAIVLGGIAGVIAGWIWAAHDWTQTVTVSEGVETVVENAAANSFWAAIVCGLSVGLLVLFVISLFLREEHDEPDTVTTGQAGAEAGSTIVIDRDEPTRATPVIRDAPAPAADRNAGVY